MDCINYLWMRIDCINYLWMRMDCINYLWMRIDCINYMDDNGCINYVCMRMYCINYVFCVGTDLKEVDEKDVTLCPNLVTLILRNSHQHH